MIGQAARPRPLVPEWQQAGGRDFEPTLPGQRGNLLPIRDATRNRNAARPRDCDPPAQTQTPVISPHVMGLAPLDL